MNGTLALANVTVDTGDPSKLAKLAKHFQSLAKKEQDRISSIFRRGVGTIVELVDIRMQQSLSIYVGCQSRKSVHLLDNSYESGSLRAAFRQCCLCVVDEIDIEGVNWEAADFNKCIQYFRTLSG